MPFCKGVERYRTWVGKVICLNKFLIVLELHKYRENHGENFKYNPSWYEEEDFLRLVRDKWKHYGKVFRYNPTWYEEGDLWKLVKDNWRDIVSVHFSSTLGFLKEKVV